MTEFVEYIKEDGTVEYRHPNYDELLRVSNEQPVNDPLFVITDEELAQINLNSLRHMRDNLIAETDWWMMPDRTATDEQIAYRQALRDITDTYTSIEDVVWPTKPE